jgi:hypothetical protein
MFPRKTTISDLFVDNERLRSPNQVIKHRKSKYAFPTSCSTQRTRAVLRPPLSLQAQHVYQDIVIRPCNAQKCHQDLIFQMKCCFDLGGQHRQAPGSLSFPYLLKSNWVPDNIPYFSIHSSSLRRSIRSNNLKLYSWYKLSQFCSQPWMYSLQKPHDI